MLEKHIQSSSVKLSIVSFWEIQLLISLKKIQIDEKFEQFSQLIMEELSLTLCSLTIPIIAKAYSKLEKMHKDPCDRFILASALEEKASLLTADEKIIHFANSNFGEICIDARK